MIVVDDLLLLHILAGRRSSPLELYITAAARGQVFTTGSWYWRAARAVSRPGRGALSAYLTSLGEEERLSVLAAVDNLPEGIGVLSLRRLVPVMAAIPGQLNLLTAEALAAAIVLDASLAVTTDSALLSGAASIANVTVEVVQLRG